MPVNTSFQEFNREASTDACQTTLIIIKTIPLNLFFLSSCLGLVRDWVVICFLQVRTKSVPVRTWYGPVKNQS
jgi:hypothetical protein